MNYGARLRDYRLKHGYSIEDLAVKLDSTKSCIAMVERGSRKLTADMAIKAAAIFDISVDQLLGVDKK